MSYFSSSNSPRNVTIALRNAPNNYFNRLAWSIEMPKPKGVESTSVINKLIQIRSKKQSRLG